MKVNEFLNEVLAAAKAAGIDPAEVYYHGGDSFNVSALDGEISTPTGGSSGGYCTMGETLMQRRRVEEEGFRIVNSCR